MTEIVNPIGVRARSVIYIIGIIAGALASVASSMMSTLNLDRWTPTIMSAIGTITMLGGVLARANLTSPAPTPGAAPAATLETAEPSATNQEGE